MRAAVLAALAVFLAAPVAAEPNTFAPSPEHIRPPRYFMAKINISDLERSVAFYTTFFDLKVAQRVDQPDYAQALLNYSGNNTDSVLILHFDKKRNPDQPVIMGNAFNDIAFSVRDLDDIAKRLKAAGHKITEPLITMPAMLPYAKTVALGFTQDPDGFKIELVEWRAE